MSRDRTREILAEIVAAAPATSTCACILHEKNQGRGATVTDGFRAARGAIAGYLDVDLEVHTPLHPVARARHRERGRRGDAAAHLRLPARSLDRYVMSRGYSFLVRAPART